MAGTQKTDKKQPVLASVEREQELSFVTAGMQNGTAILQDSLVGDCCLVLFWNGSFVTQEVLKLIVQPKIILDF